MNSAVEGELVRAPDVRRDVETRRGCDSSEYEGESHFDFEMNHRDAESTEIIEKL
jgi:hypothetical protein